MPEPAGTAAPSPTRRSQKILITIAATSLVMVVAALWSVLAAGAGHGSYLPMLGLFPFSTVTMALLTVAGDAWHPIKLVVVPGIAVLQYALYGGWIGRGWIRERAGRAFVLLAAFHALVLLALAGFYFSQGRF